MAATSNVAKRVLVDLQASEPRTGSMREGSNRNELQGVARVKRAVAVWSARVLVRPILLRVVEITLTTVSLGRRDCTVRHQGMIMGQSAARRASSAPGTLPLRFTRHRSVVRYASNAPASRCARGQQRAWRGPRATAEGRRW